MYLLIVSYVFASSVLVFIADINLREYEIGLERSQSAVITALMRGERPYMKQG